MTLNKTDRIVITLGKQIVSGKYVPGSALPAEAELCEEFLPLTRVNAAVIAFFYGPCCSNMVRMGVG